MCAGLSLMDNPLVRGTDTYRHNHSSTRAHDAVSSVQARLSCSRSIRAPGKPEDHNSAQSRARGKYTSRSAGCVHRKGSDFSATAVQDSRNGLKQEGGEKTQSFTPL